MITLPVEKRAAGGANALRKAGKVPAVVYGAHQEATPISLDARAFEKAFREAGEAAIVSLEGLGSALPTLIHEVDLDPITNRPRHVDFYAVTKGQKVEVAIPIVFSGEAPAAKAGANVVKVLHEIEIKADPMHLPHEFTVDLAPLAAVGDQIHVRDLALPAEVELVTGAEEVVALVQQIDEEKEEAPAADLSAIEVEGKGKEEEGAEAAEAEPKAE
ncbi:MAG TPA: 50S ribosomal protein L25 [Candidatus Paceibacterota bacterium]|nr:50S ribosomal protein L25 [Candidatus Paceibacterota bacterium]